MNQEDGASFVGVYASFPVEAKARHVEILRSFLALEDKLSVRRARFGPILGKLNTVSFSEELVPEILGSLENGESDFLQLIPYMKGDDWVHAYETSIHIDWKSAIRRPVGRSRSPVEERFGDAGSIIVGYPQSRFLAKSESFFQKRLFAMMRKLWTENRLHWAFVHQGFHPLRPRAIGRDDVFLATRDRYPITAFDRNLAIQSGFYSEYVGGAFCANFLNPHHISRLGAVEQILQERPCQIVERLGADSLLLQVTVSPTDNNAAELVQKYQKLRRFLSPILMETGEDMMRIQKQVLGSWRSPADADRKWLEDLAVLRKQYP